MNTIPSIDVLFPVKKQEAVVIPDVCHIDGVSILEPTVGLKAAFMGLSCSSVDSDATCSKVSRMGHGCYRVWFDHNEAISFVVITA